MPLHSGASSQHITHTKEHSPMRRLLATSETVAGSSPDSMHDAPVRLADARRLASRLQRSAKGCGKGATHGRSIQVSSVAEESTERRHRYENKTYQSCPTTRRHALGCARTGILASPATRGSLALRSPQQQQCKDSEDKLVLVNRKVQRVGTKLGQETKKNW
jgi:hypothetical protein